MFVIPFDNHSDAAASFSCASRNSQLFEILNHIGYIWVLLRSVHGGPPVSVLRSSTGPPPYYVQLPKKYKWTRLSVHLLLKQSHTSANFSLVLLNCLKCLITLVTLRPAWWSTWVCLNKSTCYSNSLMHLPPHSQHLALLWFVATIEALHT